MAKRYFTSLRKLFPVKPEHGCDQILITNIMSMIKDGCEICLFYHREDCDSWVTSAFLDESLRLIKEKCSHVIKQDTVIRFGTLLELNKATD